MKQSKGSLVILASALAWATAARATIVPVAVGTSGAAANIVATGKMSALQVNGDTSPVFPVAATDLINTGQSTLSGVSQSDSDWYFGPAGANDGVYGGNNDGANAVFQLDGDFTTTYTLDTSSSARSKGYIITNITTSTAWGSRRDQTYELSYSTVAATNTFISLGTFSLLDPTDIPPSGGNYQAGQIMLTGNTGAIISGVKSIRFHVLPSFGEAGTVLDPTIPYQDVYREFDVFGFAEVPEPSTLLLLAAGGWLLLARRSPSVGRGGSRVA